MRRQSKNRSFLRALHGYGLALAHLGFKHKALQIFEWCYEICPMDNLGVRFLIGGLKQGRDIFEI
jgi:GH15 family glucan-1,4-alpha-glucosidase